MLIHLKDKVVLWQVKEQDRKRKCMCKLYNKK